MTIYVLQRLAYLVAIVVVMSMLVFAATHVLPGDTAVLILGQYATPDALAALREKMGLNEPLPVQYWTWAIGFIQGDMGESLVMEQPVAPIVMAALEKSIVLAALAMVCVTVVGVGLGVVSAVWRGTFVDHAASMFGYLGISVPEFFWAIIFVLLFAGALRWLPSSGYATLDDGLWPFLSHLILPVVTLTLTLIAHVLRMTRSSMLDVLHSPFIKTARAKGLPERAVILRHALPNGLLPTITVLAFDFGWLIGGIVVIESVFGYPGVGRMLIYAMERHDLPLMQAIILIMTVAFTLANLIADLLYAYVNPRIRYGRAID